MRIVAVDRQQNASLATSGPTPGMAINPAPTSQAQSASDDRAGRSPGRSSFGRPYLSGFAPELARFKRGLQVRVGSARPMELESGA
jgi:hypothetical protein